MLSLIRQGAPSSQPGLLVVHGLFGSARNWGAIARRLSEDREVITVDMRNHGESFWAETHRYEDLAQDLAEVITAEGGPMDVLGHSMGGKAAMMLALQAPALVDRLLVADIAPVAYGHTQTHLITAMQALPLAAMSTRAQADTALSQHVADPSVRAFLLQSLDLRADPVRWRLNLDVLAREMDQIIGWPEVKGSFSGSCLFLGGGQSDYILPAHRPAIRALFPNARFAKLPEAGHWLHAEAPQPFADTARMWFNRAT